jgi:xylulokinase
MIIGIDVGTQSLKVAILDESLSIRGQGAVAYRPSHTRPGWAEQAPDLWLAALGPAIAAALKAAQVPPAEIKGIGVCGQLDGCIAVDQAGRALSPCIIWFDRRAGAEIVDVPADRVRNVCGQVLDPSHLAAKARWLKRHLHTEAPIARFHQPVSYVVEQLTGIAVIDHALASTSMLYALDERTYDPALLECFRISRAELPTPAAAEQCAGGLSRIGAELTGLKQGIPVAVGTGDDFATPLGGGLCIPGKVAVVLGTGEVVGALHPLALRDEQGLLETHAYPGGAFFIENPGWLSGGAVTWITDLLGGLDNAQFEALAASVPPGADGLCFIPALSGAMAPAWLPDMRGCFYGLTASHGRAHMARAVLEGCAFAMRDVVDRLAQMRVATDSLLLLGGGARSITWAQMRADLTGRPAEVPACVDSAPIGAAMLGLVAAGLAPDHASVARALPLKCRTLMPDPAKFAAYDTAYQLYRRLFDVLRPLPTGPASQSNAAHVGSIRSTH